MRAITVCVEYDDLLAITLPRNAKHFDRVCVVTTYGEHRTARVVASVPNAYLLVTDAFYRNGADFNKGLAIEQAFDALGRSGWLAVVDADIVLPQQMDLSGLQVGHLYCPRRRQLDDPAAFRDFIDLTTLRQMHDIEYAGYCQFFHAASPALAQRPWYGIDWRHAGGCDTDFQDKWPEDHRHWLDFEVLHLGQPCRNWHGRHTPYPGGALPEKHQQRRGRQREMWKQRAKHGYAKEKLP